MTIATFPSRTGVDGAGSIILAQSGVPLGIAPTGTMGANGAVTLGTALNVSFLAGLWLYFPAGAVFSGSAAGFYWTVMTNTTAGTVYTNTHTPGTNSSEIPASPTAVSAAGPGAYTGATSEVTAVSVTLPGGLLGKHGLVRYDTTRAWNATGGNKTLKYYFGGNVLGTANRSTSNTIRELVGARNAGVTGRQLFVTGNALWSYGSLGNSESTIAVDTTADVTLALTLTLATATDTHTLIGYSLIVEAQ